MKKLIIIKGHNSTAAVRKIKKILPHRKFKSYTLMSVKNNLLLEILKKCDLTAENIIKSTIIAKNSKSWIENLYKKSTMEYIMYIIKNKNILRTPILYNQETGKICFGSNKHDIEILGK